MTAPVLVVRADTRPITLPKIRRRMSWWHPVCTTAAVIPVVLLGIGVTL